MRGDVLAAKAARREEVWAALTEAGAARFPGARGRIPNFVGAEAAAERLRGTAAWTRARTAMALQYAAAGAIPTVEHDFRLDLIVTPARVIEVKRRGRAGPRRAVSGGTSWTTTRSPRSRCCSGWRPSRGRG